MKTGYVYILECSDPSFYTGVTNDIERRLAEHVEGKKVLMFRHEDLSSWFGYLMN